MRIHFLTSAFTLSTLFSTSLSCSPATRSTGAYIPTESTPSAQPQIPDTVPDIDATIQDFQKVKAQLEMRQKYASRQAQRLLPIDFFQSRTYSVQAERYAGLIQDIDQQIAMLEQKKQQLLNNTNKNLPKEVS